MSLLVRHVIFVCIKNLPEPSRGPGKGLDKTKKRDDRVKGWMKQRSVMAGSRVWWNREAWWQGKGFVVLGLNNRPSLVRSPSIRLSPLPSPTLTPLLSLCLLLKLLESCLPLLAPLSWMLIGEFVVMVWKSSLPCWGWTSLLWSIRTSGVVRQRSNVPSKGGIDFQMWVFCYYVSCVCSNLIVF